MNTSILKKCIDELQQDTFRKDYVLGMLETLYEMQEERPSVIPAAQPSGLFPKPPYVVTNVAANQDDASILDAKAKAAIAAVQEMTTLE